MNEQQFTPEQGFETIASVIREAKAQFEEDGLVYVCWGILTAAAAFAQYYLLHNGYESINYYPYFLMPLGAIASTIYGIRKEKKGKKTHLGKIIGATWVSVSISIMVCGFMAAPILTSSLLPVILILMSIGLMVSGATINSNILLYSGILANLIGFYAFTWPSTEQPLLMGIASIVCVLVPGLYLMKKHKKNNV